MDIAVVPHDRELGGRNESGQRRHHSRGPKVWGQLPNGVKSHAACSTACKRESV